MTMTNSHERYTAARATPELIGRQETRHQIKSVLQKSSKQPQVVFLIGSGGFGKTRLLRSTLEDAASLGLRHSQAAVDLYDIPTHSPSGLAEAIYQSLTPPFEPFQRYTAEQRRLADLQDTGNLTEIAEQRHKVLDTFARDLQAMASKGRVVLALDTAERLVYNPEQMPTPFPEVAEAWEWLLKSIPEWGNVVVLVAGRERTERLYKELKQTPGIKTERIEVGEFSPEESFAYFDAVARAAEADNDYETARRVAGMTVSNRRDAHTYANGQPILLALVIDHLCDYGVGRLPPLLEQPNSPSGNVQLNAEDKEELEAQLIRRLVETPELGDTVVYLGRARKGVDAQLLANLLDITLEKAEARLDRVKRLSFVKERGGRMFLHDEMYSMLGRYVIDTPNGDRLQRDALEIIVTYYRLAIARSRDELSVLYAPVELRGLTKLDTGAIARVTAQLHILQTEHMYYRLYLSAADGFKYYYRYSYDAVLSGETAFDIQLQAEMMSFLQERDPTGQEAIIDGLDRSVVLGFIALRPIIRTWAEGKHQLVVKLSEQLKEDKPHLLQTGGVATPLALGVWEAFSRIYLGTPDHLARANAILDQAVDTLHKVLANPEIDSESQASRKWRAQAVLAFAYRVRGYYWRVRGYLDRAINDYRQSVRLWRKVTVDIQLAATLNDLGFAMALEGDLENARPLAEEALQIRQKLGPRLPVGLSLNTSGLIELRDGNFLLATSLCQRALHLFRALGAQRGEGLALIALAEARRRSVMAQPNLEPEEQINILREARDNARDALDIFINIKEKDRQVEALLEQGCACREWIRIRREQQSNRDNLSRIVQESAEAFDRAANIAGEDLLHRKVDALVNKAFLGFFANSDELVANATSAAEASIPSEYRINPKTGSPDVSTEDAQVLLWPHLGKLYTLYGHQAFRRYQATSEYSSEGTSALVEAVRNYVFSLAYNSLHNYHVVGRRQAQDQIYKRLKDVKPKHLQIVADALLQAEQELGEQHSELRQLLQRRALLEI